MFSGDNFSVSSFFISLAAAFCIQTLRPEIRRVRIVMLITAAVLFLIGIVWPFLGVISPMFAGSGFAVSVVSLTSNVWAWFILLMVVLLTSSILPALDQQRNAEGREKQVATFSGPVAIGSVLFVMFFAYSLYSHSLLRVVRGELNLVQSQLQGVQKELNLVRDDMVRYVIPRSLTPEQKTTVAKYLSKNTPHALIMKVISRNEEANSYAVDLRQALENGGWPVGSIIYDDAVLEGVRVEMSEPMQESKPGPVDPFDGLKDRLSPKKKPPDIIREAFEQAGVIVEGGSGSVTGITTTIITIFVGNRRRDKWAIPSPL